MVTFVSVATTFPTLLFGALLGLAMLYWLLAATGLVRLNLLDGLSGAEAGADVASATPGDAAGPLMKLGLGGVPVPLAGTALLLFAWLLSYFGTLLLAGDAAGARSLAWGPRTVVLVVALAGALPLSALALRPARRFFARLQPASQQSLLGREGVVRSPEVTAGAGLVAVEDGGAGLVLQARSTGRACGRGERVRLVEYLPGDNAYRVETVGVDAAP